MQRDEEIKRLTGQLTDEQDYEDWRLERKTPRTPDPWHLTDAEIDELEREAFRRAGHTPGALRAHLPGTATFGGSVAHPSAASVRADRG